jgi:nitrile hydratase accessory protein
LNPLDAGLAALRQIPRHGDEAVFPTAWAARAFALAVALNERSLFTWSEWSETLAAKLAAVEADLAADAESYWRAWLPPLRSW